MVVVIDTHVHLRDFDEAYKGETVQHGLEVARDSGVVAVLDMPNTRPAIMTREIVLQRLALAKVAHIPEVFYGLYMGLTRDPEQIKRAVDTYREFPQVVGMKLYAGHSVNELGIISLEDQATVYSTLAEQGFDGILPVHAEKEGCLRHDLWNSLEPITHCHARPERAEVESVRDQIALASEYQFKGKLHIAHISSPKAVELVRLAKETDMDISCGICPHHFIYDWQQMLTPDGLLYKMNPPLRSPESRERCLQLLRDGHIDWIETDHAPHTLDEKMRGKILSGITGLAWWPVFIEFLRRHNFSESRIEDVVFNNAVQRIGLPVEYLRRPIKDRRSDYPFNFYRPIEMELGYQ